MMFRQRLLSRLARLSLGLLAVCAPPAAARSGPAGGQKLAPQEVVAKHLESIGTAAARASVRNRIILGTTTITLRAGGRGTVEGRALMASEGERVLVNAVFSDPAYPYEKIGFDGKALTVRPLSPGVRSPLGQFFLAHEVFFKEGLFGGTLSAAWPLLNLSERDPKLEYAGLKKVGDRPAHELKYTPRRGSDLRISLFFDAENFRHLRTDYERVVAATMGAAPGQSAGRRETRFRIREDFSDFREEGGLMLPHTYKFQLNVQSQSNPIVLDWAFSLAQFTFNQSMGVKEFNTEA